MVDRAIHKAWITSAFVEADESPIRRRVVHCVGIVILGCVPSVDCNTAWLHLPRRASSDKWLNVLTDKTTFSDATTRSALCDLMDSGIHVCSRACIASLGAACDSYHRYTHVAAVTKLQASSGRGNLHRFHRLFTASKVISEHD